MGLITIIGIALGLSMDALAVSVANGCLIRNLRFHQAFVVALSFGLFQAAMPLIGFFGAGLFRDYIADYDHWIACGLLTFIGLKMIHESFSKKDETVCEETPAVLQPLRLLTLSVATSIDALAVGISFAFLGISVAMPVTIIGLITFGVCLAGVYAGNRIGHIFENRLETVGGLVLIAIGIKIVVEHIL